MNHPDGITMDEKFTRVFSNQLEHDPANLNEAREIAEDQNYFPIGLFYRNEFAHIYDKNTRIGLGKSPAEKLTALETALDRCSV